MNRTILMLLILANIFAGCKKEGTTAPPVVVKGDLMGTVVLANEFGISAANSSGITVSVEGTTLSAQTDASGNYSIKGIEEGEKTISYSKIDYGTFKEDIVIEGNSTKQLNGIKIYEIPSFNVINLSSNVVSGGFEISGNITNTLDNYRGIRLFAFSDSTVSSEPNKYLYVLDDRNVSPNSNTFTVPVQFSDLIAKGFSSGSHIYFVCYGSVSYGHSEDQYVDKKTNKAVYCPLSKIPSNKIVVILP